MYLYIYDLIYKYKFRCELSKSLYKTQNDAIANLATELFRDV